jgi:hypothetical protein
MRSCIFGFNWSFDPKSPVSEITMIFSSERIFTGTWTEYNHYNKLLISKN